MFKSELFLSEKLNSIKINDGDLTITKYKNQIIEAVKNNQIIIIEGQTGCGKTTQIPQFILRSGLNNGKCIGITQPRKIVAVSMAYRVSKEMESPIGIQVGYEVRFEKKLSSSTRIKYMTDGILLNEFALVTRLSDYEIIMIDEAHERSSNSDVLLGLLKELCKKRSDLKLILASATISIQKFSNYFKNAVVLSIEDRLHPIEVIYTKFCMNYVSKAVQIIEEIHHCNNNGDILVFLTGEGEIEECCNSLQNIENLVVKPLYGSIDFQCQQSVFQKVQPNQRKVVVATNIAETSITVSGIRFVIDCGYVKQNNFNSKRGINTLEDVKISKAQAIQRMGRAGREDYGWCYRLYTQSMYDNFTDEITPEIFRTNLIDIVLNLIELGKNPFDFEFIDRPCDEELKRSTKELIDLEIINENCKLTEIGELMKSIPIEPMLRKVLYYSISKCCVESVLKIISMLSEKIIFRRPNKFKKEADIKKKEFSDSGGDHFTFLNVYNKWKAVLNKETSKKENDKQKNINENKEVKKWCLENFIDFNSMLSADRVYSQIQRSLGNNNKTKSYPDKDLKIIIKNSILSGYFKNICVKQSNGTYVRVLNRETLFIHPSSVLFRNAPKIILYHEVRKTSRSFMHGIMELEEDLIKSFSRELKIINYPDDLDELSRF